MGRNDRPAEFLVIFDQALAEIEHGQISESMKALKPSASVGRLVRNMALPRSILDKLWALRVALASCLKWQAASAKRPRDQPPSILTKQQIARFSRGLQLLKANDRVFEFDSKVIVGRPDKNGNVLVKIESGPTENLIAAIACYLAQLKKRPISNTGRPPSFKQAAITLLAHILAVEGKNAPLRVRTALTHALIDDLLARYDFGLAAEADRAPRHTDAIIRANKRIEKNPFAKAQ